MKLEWTDREVVFISDVGTVGPGTEFEIEDSRGQDLVTRGAARIVKPKALTKEVRTMSERQSAKHILVEVKDSVGVGEKK